MFDLCVLVLVGLWNIDWVSHQLGNFWKATGWDQPETSEGQKIMHTANA